jgi:hypothetical protein
MVVYLSQRHRSEAPTWIGGRSTAEDQPVPGPLVRRLDGTHSDSRAEAKSFHEDCE